MIKKYIIAIIFITIIFTGCVPKISLSDYPSKIYMPITIPDSCKSEYKKLMKPPKIAVINFTNNSNFGVGKVTNKSNSYKAGINLGVTPFGIGAGVNKKNNQNIVNRIVDPKLDKAITSAFETILANMGGVEVYSRNDLEKILKEQKLEHSGLFNSQTLTKLGKLTGVNYIITGSIDSVSQEYKDYTDITRFASSVIVETSKNKKTALLTGTAAQVANKFISGMKITTTVSFRVLDIETGKILFSKQITESKNIGRYPNPKYSQIIGAIKYNIIQGLQQVKSEFSTFFTPKGYILQVRSDKSYKNFIAQINLGSKDHILPGQTFKVYKFNEFIDPVTHKKQCDTSFMNIKLIVSKNQIQEHRSWSVVNGKNVKEIRVGNIVKRDKLKSSIFDF